MTIDRPPSSPGRLASVDQPDEAGEGSPATASRRLPPCRDSAAGRGL